jgi:hypothetical protein
MTCVLAASKGKIPSDEVPISTLSLGAKAGKDFTMIGTPEGDEFKAPIDVPDVRSCLSITYFNKCSPVTFLERFTGP